LGAAPIVNIFVPGSADQPKGGLIIETLTTKQRAYLKTLAHSLKPVHQVGKEGLTVPGIRAIREAFNTREILKVKVQDSAPADVRAIAEELVAGLEDTHLVQVIGRTLVLYRPDPDDPEIELP
jgi:RNA-binding protein